MGPLSPGLCSVTYRRLPPHEVVRLAVDAGLAVVEWGADVHTPLGDAERLADVRRLSAAGGLAIVSLGSYFRAGPHGDAEFAPVLAAATALGARRIRVWAGVEGSAAACDDAVRSVVSHSRSAARIAAEQGVELAFEFHHGTLTDSVESTLRLLDEIGEPNVSTYWQPPLDLPDDEALAGFIRLRERVSGLHVFSWWPGKTRLPLTARRGLWRDVFVAAAQGGRRLDALLEFVPDDDPALLAAEAEVLTGLIEEATR